MVFLVVQSALFNFRAQKLPCVHNHEVNSSANHLVSFVWFEPSCLCISYYLVVRIHSSVSDPLPVECGVPQGSILGPLLFSIYVNDLPEVSRHCSTECYVDDTKLFVSFNLHDSQRIVEQMNGGLLQVRNWCFGNLLLLNPDKTKLIVFESRQMTSKLHKFHLSLLGKVISPV